MLKVMMIGNITKDLELRKTSSGTIVCDFDVACNSFRHDTTTFVNVVLFNGSAENAAKFLGKGSKVGVFGNLRLDTYEKKDGTKGYSLKVDDAEIEYLNSKKEGVEEDERKY